MALLPAISGIVIVGATPTTIWLLIAWILCYCVQFTASRWLRSRLARRYATPVLIYTVLLAIIGLPFIIVNPGILRWAPIYVFLAFASFVAAWLRQERSLWGNAVAIIAACLMATIVVSTSNSSMMCTGNAAHSSSCLTNTHNEFDLFLHKLPTLETWWSASTLPILGILATTIFAVEQFSSVLFVKTMIRERNNRQFLWASWIWHAALLVTAIAVGMLTGLWWTSSMLLTIVAIWLLMRAIVLPIIARRRPIKPIVVGMIEMVSSLLTFAVVLAITI